MRERAVRLVLESRSEYSPLWAAIESIAPKFGCTPQTLHEWVKRDEIERGRCAGSCGEHAASVGCRASLNTKFRIDPKKWDTIHPHFFNPHFIMGKHVGRQRLLDCATDFFRARGYSATGIDEIVKACGITKGSLYHHFSGKEELALAAMDQVHDYFRQHIFRLIAAIEHPGAKELKAFNRAVEKFYLSHPDGCLLANLSLEIGTDNKPFAEKIGDFFRDWRACYAAVFAQNHTPSRAATLAEDAVAAIQGCILMYRIDGNIAPLRRLHRHLILMFVPKAA